MPTYDKTIKMKAGSKYGRMQQYGTLSKQQQKILDKYEKYVKPRDFQTPQMFNQGLDVLRQGMQAQGPGQAEQSGLNYLQGIMSQDPAMMKQFEAPYMRQFNEEVVPQIAERFAGMGGMNSSGFQQTMGQAGSSLMERLAALRGGLGMAAAQQAAQYAQLPMQRQQMQGQFAQAGMQASLYPQQQQEEYNRYAQQLQDQRRGAVLGTQPFNWATVDARQNASKESRNNMWGSLGSAAITGAATLFGGPAAGAGAGMVSRQIFSPQNNM